MDDQEQACQVYNLVDIIRYLQKECPDEIPTLPPMPRFAITRIYGQLANGDAGNEALTSIRNWQLLLGRSTGEYTTNYPVYLCIGGEGNNKASLKCNDKIYKFDLDNLSYVDLQPPFRKLLREENEVEVLQETEKRRLKAFGCYLHLKHGHIQTIQHYSGFLDDLRYAVTWFARKGNEPVRTARQKAAILRQKAESAKENSESSQKAASMRLEASQSRHEISPSPGIDRAATSLRSTSTRMPGQDSVLDNDSIDHVPLDASKKRKPDENTTELRRRYETAGRHLLAFEAELAAMKLDPGSVAELKRVISKQASEIAKLKEQLNLKNAELKTANTDAFNSERNAREEATRREDAEARLKEYLDAQKRMAAMYSGA